MTTDSNDRVTNCCFCCAFEIGESVSDQFVAVAQVCRPLLSNDDLSRPRNRFGVKLLAEYDVRIFQRIL